MSIRNLFIAPVIAVLAVLVAAPAHAVSYRLHTAEMPDGSIQVARWDPCETVTYLVNVKAIKGRSAQRRAVRMTKATVARLASKSGLDFTFQGRTRIVPKTSNLGTLPADLVVGFVRPGQSDYPLSGAIAGYGGYRAGYVKTPEDQWRLQIRNAFVLVDQPQTLDWSSSPDRHGVTRANVVKHELGHAVGLSHVDDKRQIMNDFLHADSPAGFGSGDREGLRRVGAAAGCISG